MPSSSTRCRRGDLPTSCRSPIRPLRMRSAVAKSFFFRASARSRSRAPSTGRQAVAGGRFSRGRFAENAQVAANSRSTAAPRRSDAILAGVALCRVFQLFVIGEFVQPADQSNRSPMAPPVLKSSSIASRKRFRRSATSISSGSPAGSKSPCHRGAGAAGREALAGDPLVTLEEAIKRLQAGLDLADRCVP